MRARSLLLLAATAFGMACAGSQPTVASPTRLPAWSYAVRKQTQEREERRDRVRVPSEWHRRLDTLVGTFRATLSSWSEAQGEPSVSSGTTTNGWVAGGRFLRCELRGSLHGQPYERQSMIGYDRARERFVESRVDNSTTQMLEVAEGVLSESGRELVFEREWRDPGQERPVKLREVLHVEDHDHHRWEQWVDGPGGRDYRSLEIRFERVR